MLFYQWLTENAERCGNTKAVIYRDTYLSWRGLLERVERRAMELKTIGIQKGHFVGLMLGNVPEFIIFTLALSKLQANTLPIDPTTGVRELQQFLETVPLRALITRPRGGTDPSPSLAINPPRLQTHKTATDLKQSSTIEPEVRKRLQGTLITCALYRRDRLTQDLIPITFLSSDEEGSPRAIPRTEENLVAHCESFKEAIELTPKDHLLGLLPLYSSYGFECSFLPALRYGATFFLEEETAPARILRLLREQEITIFPAVPRIYGSLTKMVTIPPKIGTRRPRFLSSESYLDPTIAALFTERFGPKIHSLYRSVEAGVIAIDREGNHPETVGIPVPGVEVDLRPSAREGSSLIFVRSKTCSHSSLGLRSASSNLPSNGPFQSLLVDSYLPTGDLGYFTESGALVLSGREDDRVKIGEKRVVLHEITHCLQTHPKVREVEVKTKLDTDQTFLLTAEARCKEACEEEELLDHCARFLAPYKVPRKIEITIGT